MAKQSFMVCATFRPENRPSPLRYFGILHLVEEAKAQKYEGALKLAIVDSSPVPHPFFANPEELLTGHGIAYIHTPNREENAPWRNRFTEASKFVPTDDDLTTPYWKNWSDSIKDWDDFLLFEENFKESYKGPRPSEFMHMSRPAIGMKKTSGSQPCHRNSAQQTILSFATMMTITIPTMSKQSRKNCSMRTSHASAHG